MDMDGDGDSAGIENKTYLEDDAYLDIEWADNVDADELTANEVIDAAAENGDGKHADAAVVESLSRDDEDDSTDDPHHVMENSHNIERKFKNNSAVMQVSDGLHTSQYGAVMDSETNKGATFHNIPLMGSFRYVTQTSDSGVSTRSQTDTKHQSGMVKPNETRTVMNVIPQDAPDMDRTNKAASWLSRCCTDAVFRRNVGESIAVQSVVVSMGWIYGVVGPSLPDLQIISGMGLQEASWIFTGFAIGYMIGCVSSGLVISRFNARVMLAVSCSVAGVAAGILPLVPNGYVMVVMRIVGGVAMGVQDTTLTARLFEIWGSAGGPWLQMSHFMFAFGGIISPLLVKPFLAKQFQPDVGVYTTNEAVFDITQAPFEFSTRNGTYYPDNNTASMFDSASSTSDGVLSVNTESTIIAPIVGKSNIHYAYLISAVLSVMSAVPFIMYYLKDRNKFKQDGPVEQISTGDNEINSKKLPKKSKYLLLTLMCASSLIGTGYIDLFPNYLTSFGILQLGATKEDGSSATSIYFAMYAVGNGVGVVALRYVSSAKFITLSHVATVVTLALYYISVLQLSTPVQWIFIAFSGFAMSSILPTMFTWTQDHVTPISGSVASVYLVSGSLGVMMTPMFLGYLMENVTPMWFLYVCFLFEGTCIVLFLTAVIIVTYIVNHNSTNDDSTGDNTVQTNPAFQTDVGQC